MRTAAVTPLPGINVDPSAASANGFVRTLDDGVAYRRLDEARDLWKPVLFRNLTPTGWLWAPMEQLGTVVDSVALLNPWHATGYVFDNAQHAFAFAFDYAPTIDRDLLSAVIDARIPQSGAVLPPSNQELADFAAQLARDHPDIFELPALAWGLPGDRQVSKTNNFMRMGT